MFVLAAIHRGNKATKTRPISDKDGARATSVADSRPANIQDTVDL
jgi:hypothetical protein